MPAPQPATKVADLYNRLVRLPCEERDQIGVIEWQLRKLRRDTPSDPSVAVALMFAFMKAGKAAEAHALADEVRARQSMLDGQVAYSFLTELAQMGRFSEAIRFFRDHPELRGSKQAAGKAFSAAIGLGDIDLAMGILNSLDIPAPSGLLSFQTALRTAGLFDMLPGHQGKILELLGGRFCAFDVNFFDNEDEGTTELSLDFFLDADRLERRLMEQSIDEALTGFYQNAGMDPLAYVPLIVASIHDIAGLQNPIEP